MSPIEKPVVISSGTYTEVSLEKVKLEVDEIEATIIDEHTGTDFPWFDGVGSVGGCKLIVASEDAERALQALKK